ncbi:MAG: SH3 domain-containing protein [Clostridia bacterium]|nr:SH3 domain-containing protein [Clostridia bacterium]
MMKRALCALLCLCLLMGTVAFGVQAADTVVTGTVFGIDADSKLYVRESASTSATVLDKLVNGDVVTILDTKEAGGITWYKVTTPSGKTGYSSAQYIRINVDYQTDEEFEAYLTAQKFPETYKVKLRQLWAQHPTWIFKAQHLSMTWKRATNEESRALKNAITTPESWMSMEKGAYNWTTKTYVPVDSGGWVTACKQVVSYYMDPRNFLDETYIFQFEDLQYSDTQTLAGVKAILPSRYDKYAEDLLKAAKETTVSAYFLATRMTQEGSKIDGDFVGDDGTDYSGYYNFFNYGAYAGSQYGAYHGAVTNGAIYAKQAGWDSPYKCLLGSAEKIGSGYINKGQNTLYYQKFNVAGENLYNHQYMTNVQAPSSEGRIRANSATDAEKAGALTFIIPVYKTMPEEATTLPPKTGNNNNFLDKITVTGCTLSPTFDRYVKTYTGEITDPSVTSVKISATKNYSSAKVVGTGTKTLKPGENVFPITVTATSGQTRTYTVTIIAPEDGGTSGDNTPTPSVSGSYTVGETVTGVQPATTAKDFLSAVKVKNGTAALYTAAGSKKTDGAVATGDILRVYDNDKRLTASYPVVIYGDVNGDGKVNSVDLRRAQRHILGVIKVEGYFLTAADANRDGKVNSVDLRRAQRYILGLLKDLQP